MITYDGRWLKCYEGGLTLGQWAFCLFIGAGVIVWQQLINKIAVWASINSTPGGSHEGGLLKFKSGSGSGHITPPKGATANATRSASFKRQQTSIQERRSARVSAHGARSVSLK